MNLPGVCTNVLPGADWPQAHAALSQTLAELRQHLAASPLRDRPLPLDLWLGANTTGTLRADPAALASLRQTLENHRAEVTMLNGFPFGPFHGQRVKEAVYQPDWQDPARARYTQELFELLHQLAPPGRALSVSTLPGSHKSLIPPAQLPAARATIRRQLRDLAHWLDDRAATWNRDLHLGLEPEPFGLFEDLPETLEFFDFLHTGASPEESACLGRRLGLNFDTCHFALQFQPIADALDTLSRHAIRLSKVHLSSALELDLSATSDPAGLLRPFDEPVYLHQVISRAANGCLRRWPDLGPALADAAFPCSGLARIHFHIPVHADPAPPLRGTTPALLEALAWLTDHPTACHHLALETYTFAVLPAALRPPSIAAMLARELQFITRELAHLHAQKPAH